MRACGQFDEEVGSTQETGFNLTSVAVGRGLTVNLGTEGFKKDKSVFLSSECEKGSNEPRSRSEL